MMIRTGSLAWPGFGGCSSSSRCCEAMVFADELDIHLLPKVGCAWMPKGSQLEVMTPGPKSEALSRPGPSIWPLGPCATAWERAKPTRCSETCWISWRRSYPAERYTRVYVVVDNYKIHKAKAVEQWLAAHPRVTPALFADLLSLGPTRLSARSAMCMTAARVTIDANAYSIW